MAIFQTFWAHVFGKEAPSSPPPKLEVVTHDPQSLKPHNLDDPFFDNKIQERIGDAIAKAARKP